MRRLRFALLTVSLSIAGCEQLGIESSTAVAAHREAEGKAIGAGCRHAARSVEVCYGLNKRSDKAAIFGGWREMNDYMRENKIDPMPPAAESETAVAAVAGEAPEAGAVAATKKR